MRIAFDATAILGPMSKNRGIGNYVLSQFLHMIRQDPDNQYFFLNWIDKDFHLSDRLPGVTNLTEDFIDTGSQNVLLRETENLRGGHGCHFAAVFAGTAD